MAILNRLVRVGGVPQGLIGAARAVSYLVEQKPLHHFALSHFRVETGFHPRFREGRLFLKILQS